MVFSSPIFVFLFLPIVLALYFFIRRELRNFILLIASLFFYAWGEPKLVLLMILSILTNYFFGLSIHKRRKHKTAKIILAGAVIFNIGFLVFFKYANFLVDNLNAILSCYDIQGIYLSPIHLPIGISFFTFQALSYVIDVYRQTTKIQKNLLNLGLYISLFPQLIAGPIVRYYDIAEQIDNRIETIDKLASGIRRFTIGFGKKIIIANTVGTVADKVFAVSSNSLTSGIAWLGIICYTMQIYYDFSGYSDMAIGLGKMFGFHFLENFNYPYISRSIKEFWRRWHISLSSWFKDYLYIPLGGSRCSTIKTYRNLFIVFLLTGLWHGASWNFIIWGLFHGFFLILERLYLDKLIRKIWAPIAHAYTLTIVMIGWVFFRAETLPYALSYIKALFGLGQGSEIVYYPGIYLNNEILIVLFIGVLGSMPILKQLIDRIKKNVKSQAVIAVFQEFYVMIVLIVSTMYLASSTYNPFIYFRF